MHIEVLGSSGGETPDWQLTSLLINDRVALDAGSLTRALPIERQAGVEAVVLSHSHADHVFTLPFFVENVYRRRAAPIVIYGGAATLQAVRRHLFNDDLWPDFSRLPNEAAPAMRFQEIRPFEPIELAGVRLTPIPVHHPVPTFGFLLEQGASALLWSSDTGPTDELWRVANATEALRAVWVDTSFDNSLQDVADASMHLTPRTLGAELAKLERRVPVLLHHLKPPCRERILEEVQALGRAEISLLEQGRCYAFD
jgi:ribonuclease BN (tRNA processing enzyme)